MGDEAAASTAAICEEEDDPNVVMKQNLEDGKANNDYQPLVPL